jgi:hypothetical protein
VLRGVLYRDAGAPQPVWTGSGRRSRAEVPPARLAARWGCTQAAALRRAIHEQACTVGGLWQPADPEGLRRVMEAARDYYASEFGWRVRLEPSEQNGLTKPSAVDAFQVKSISTRRLVTRIGFVAQGITDRRYPK